MAWAGGCVCAFGIGLLVALTFCWDVEGETVEPEPKTSHTTPTTTKVAMIVVITTGATDLVLFSSLFFGRSFIYFVVEVACEIVARKSTIDRYIIS